MTDEERVRLIAALSDKARALQWGRSVDDLVAVVDIELVCSGDPAVADFEREGS